MEVMKTNLMMISHAENGVIGELESEPLRRKESEKERLMKREDMKMGKSIQEISRVRWRKRTFQKSANLRELQIIGVILQIKEN